MNAPWRRKEPTLAILAPPVTTRATAQLDLLVTLLAEFLPRPEAARTQAERVRLQMLIATVSPMLSTLTQGWDEAKADATGAILRSLGARQAALDAEWAEPAPAAIAGDVAAVP